MWAGKVSSGEFGSGVGVVSLHGVEALELYLLGIDRNFHAIDEQVALLQVALLEREELLRELDACRRKEDELLLGIAASQSDGASP